MIVDLANAYVGYLKPLSHASRQNLTGLPGVLSELAECRTEATLERERRLTIALVVRELPPGVCLISRDGTGRGFYIGPADKVVAHELLEAA